MPPVTNILVKSGGDDDAAINVNYLPVVKTNASEEVGRRTVQSQVDMASGRSLTQISQHSNFFASAIKCRYFL